MAVGVDNFEKTLSGEALDQFKQIRERLETIHKRNAHKAQLALGIWTLYGETTGKSCSLKFFTFSFYDLNTPEYNYSHGNKLYSKITNHNLAFLGSVFPLQLNGKEEGSYL